MHRFEVDPEFHIDSSEDVKITAYVEGEAQLAVHIDFSTEDHAVRIVALNNCLSYLYQLELAGEAAAWFDNEFFA